MARLNLMGIRPGFTHGKWTVLGKPIRQGNQTLALCRCSCRRKRMVNLFAMLHGTSEGCGCGKTIAVAAGDMFGRWTVESRPFRKGVYVLAKCRCQCGTRKIVNVNHLVMGRSKSCGCLRAEPNMAARTHGDSTVINGRSRLYRIWAAMRTRCCNRRTGRDWRNYGGRGIRVCRAWRTYETFKQWAMGSGYQDGLTIERKDVNGHYCPDNCKWIPARAQARNRRDSVYLTAFGETKHLCDWAIDPRCTVKWGTLKARVYAARGWTNEEIIATPKTHRYMRGKLRATT